MLERRIEKSISQDLLNKMVFIAGPRQCGKTFLSKRIAADYNSTYYNWDIKKDRKRIVQEELEAASQLWIFDEIHKYPKWKNYLKGMYDAFCDSKKILVTGSAKLNVYQRGGDSLQGRYYNYRLHPLTLGEISKTPIKYDSIESMVEEILHSEPGSPKEMLNLLSLSGFPEPFLSQSERIAKRWSHNYAWRLIEEDIRDLTKIVDYTNLEILFDRLPDVISSQVSFNTFAKDLELHPATIKNWLNTLEKLYALFYIDPYGTPSIKSIKKMKKMYLWDWGRISDPGARLENFVALHLLRLVHYFEDLYGEKYNLKYYKDSMGNEIDFILLKKTDPILTIEVKSSETELDRGLRYFLEKNRCKYNFQIVLKTDKFFQMKSINSNKIWVMPVDRFLRCLP